MSETERHIRRILVALDASPHSEAALQAAARVSNVFGATLSGVYVEDADLLKAAALPFSREIRRHSGGDTLLSHAVLRRQMRLQQFRAIRSLERAANRYGLQHAFTITSGRVADALIEEAKAADLITMGQASAQASSRGKIGSTVRELLTHSPASILIARHGVRLDLPVAVVIDQRAADHHYALELAAELAEADFDSPLILLISGDLDFYQRWSSDVASRFDPELWVRCAPVHGDSPEHVAQVAHQHGAGILVLASECGAARLDRIGRLAALVTGPILIARSPDPGAQSFPASPELARADPT